MCYHNHILKGVIWKKQILYIDIQGGIIDNKGSKNSVSVKKGECYEQESIDCWRWKSYRWYIKS